jgi:hypothetical protein
LAHDEDASVGSGTDGLLPEAGQPGSDHWPDGDLLGEAAFDMSSSLLRRSSASIMPLIDHIATAM